MIDDHDIARPDEIYVRKDDCQDIQNYEEPYQQYSYASEPEQVETTVNYNSDAEFFQLANGMEYDRVWKIIAELMETLQVINPRLYAGVIKKLKA